MGKRRFIQLISAMAYNAYWPGFMRGTIYKGNIKGVCVPGLNCYSCPGAMASCPLGSLQAALGEIKYKLPFYTVGMLLLFGVLLGRAVCAFLCPFGLIQELLYKFPTPKLRKNRATRIASWSKYAILAIFVIIIPLFYAFTKGTGVPAFCKYICPAGTLEGGIPLVITNDSLKALTGALFQWKMAVLTTIVVGSVFIFRCFCRFLCPLGAIYSLFNRFALFGIRVDTQKCTGCNTCVNTCKMDVRRINDRECLRCGECRPLCKHNAVYNVHKGVRKCDV